MKTSDFFYELPDNLIAQDPLADRTASRLMVLRKDSDKIAHNTFRNILDYLNPGDLLVRNNTKVIPARLYGRKLHPTNDLKDFTGNSSDLTYPKNDNIFTSSLAYSDLKMYNYTEGAAVEVFLLKRISDDSWEALVRPGKKLRTGALVRFSDELYCIISDVLSDGNRIVRFLFDKSVIFEEILDRLGQVPLPPYIKHELKDRDRYQTVYAKYDGSAAAPTAGLHFTDELFDEVRSKGVGVADVTLHVGLGTFRPVKVDDVTEHHMHSEHYIVTEETADIINRTKTDGGRVICVGTTSCRTIESAADNEGHISATEGDTDIFIYPGYKFKLTDGLITNFHLPESTLLMLVSALTSREKILSAYSEAVKEKYRFFSFGDAMLII